MENANLGQTRVMLASTATQGHNYRSHPVHAPQPQPIRLDQESQLDRPEGGILLSLDSLALLTMV